MSQVNASNAVEDPNDAYIDENEPLEGGVNFTPPVESVEEALTRYEQFTRMGVQGLIEQGAKYASGYGKALSALEALAEVCVALMTKYPAPVWTDTNKVKPRGYISPKDKDKKVKDWGGQSEQYAKSIQKIYDRAGVGNNESQIRNNLKYWRQNLVKKVAPSDDLIALGMKTAKRGAGGVTNQTQPAATTGQVRNPVQAIEQVGPRIIQLRDDVLKNKATAGLKADDKKKLVDQLKRNINALIDVYKFLVNAKDEDEMTIGAYGFRQTPEAKAASAKEATEAPDGKK